MHNHVYMSIPEVISKLTPNILNCINVLTNYGGNDWKKFLYKTPQDNQYSKILIAKNDVLDVYIIFWGKNSSTGIHDHPPGGCVAKVLEGELQEYTYLNVKEKGLASGSNILSKNSVTNRVGRLFLHKIQNRLEEGISASIHVYFPPNFKSNTYEEMIE
jgi:predicted metal-dependent enzyme (double-stranded beta helix superfamily)